MYTLMSVFCVCSRMRHSLLFDVYVLCFVGVMGHM